LATTTYSAGDCIDIATIRCIKWKSSATADPADVDCIYIGSNLIYDANTFIMSASETTDALILSDHPTLSDQAGGTSTAVYKTAKYAGYTCWSNNAAYSAGYVAQRVYKCPDGLDGADKASVLVDWGDPTYNDFYKDSINGKTQYYKSSYSKVTTASSNKYVVWAQSNGNMSSNFAGCGCNAQVTGCGEWPVWAYNAVTGWNGCKPSTQSDFAIFRYKYNTKVAWGDSTVTNTNTPSSSFGSTNGVARLGFVYAPGGYVSGNPSGSQQQNCNGKCYPPLGQGHQTCNFKFSGHDYLVWAHYDPGNNNVVVNYVHGGEVAGNGDTPASNSAMGALFSISDDRQIKIIKGGRNTNGPSFTGSQGWDASA
jgi:hypothetical protein